MQGALFGRLLSISSKRGHHRGRHCHVSCLPLSDPSIASLVFLGVAFLQGWDAGLSSLLTLPYSWLHGHTIEVALPSSSPELVLLPWSFWRPHSLLGGIGSALASTWASASPSHEGPVRACWSMGWSINFHTSTGMSSGPVALPFFILFTAFVTSAEVTGGTGPRMGSGCESVDVVIPLLRWQWNTRSNGRVWPEGCAILSPQHSWCASLDQWLGSICAASLRCGRTFSPLRVCLIARTGHGSTQLSPWPLPVTTPPPPPLDISY